ncbi:MAG: hypothetical protein IKU27_05010, partial [Clostridia bacterium]|nr:hypothetical protein [Clostridia bacterium]
MKKRFESLVGGIKKSANALIDNTLQAVDQNDDGKFDFSDVAAMAESVGNAVKKGSQAVMETAEEKARLMELKSLQPIFPDTLSDANFSMPKFIRVVEREKKYIDSIVCQGSIGYNSEQKGLHIVNIFKDSLESFGLNFYPDPDCEFYYVDPSDRDRYISLDEYFAYIKIVRINELKKLAQDLGAKRFRVTYMEEQVSFTEKNMKASLKTPVSAEVSHSISEKKFTNIKIESESDFPGHAPIKPQLKYMQHDPSIQNLIAMRMDESSPLLHEKFMI